MADYRNDDDRTLPGVGMNRTPETDPEHLLPDHTSAGAVGSIPAAALSGDPDAVRDEIERTRARMSRTIDQLDRALVRKKTEVQEKLDVAAPIRQRPWVYAGGVFAAGLALGLITGGGKRDDDEDDDHVKIPKALLAGIGLQQARGGRGSGDDVEVEYTGEGSDDWETRARELMSVVARQEEEIRSLRGGGPDETWYDDPDYLSPTDARLLDDVEALSEHDVQDEWDEDWNFVEGGYNDELGDTYTGQLDGDLYMGSEYDAADYEVELDQYARSGIDFKKPLAMLLAAGVAGALGTLGKRVLGGRDDEELDVEVELEPRGGLAEDVYVDEAGRSARRAARHQAGPAPRAREYGPEYGAAGGERYAAAPAPRRAGAYETRGAYDAGYGYTGEHGGEMEVEVDLEQPVRRTGYTGEMEVEVELERPVRRSLPPRRRRPRVSPLAGAVAAGAAAAVSGLVAKLIHSRAERASEMEVEVELEQPRRQPAPVRRSPAPQRPAAAYTPQPAARPQASAGGELEVEVELETPRATPATGSWTPSAHPEQAISGSAFGSTASAGASDRPTDVEVDAETRGATRAAGGTVGYGTGGQPNHTGTPGSASGSGNAGGGTGTGGSTPSNPPLM
ncbi:MAG TPA: DUF3618 domain-containing protein [Longimicrobium sp.]|nr:DUF3618 domain-containing protein [Longimicrobium sp.]